jgi:23S rRNA pseudouridine1911/1915/1917 synthase
LQPTIETRKIQLKILYEDNHLLVVLKPPGLLIQGDSTGRPTLLEVAKEYLKNKYRKPGQVYLGLVHRLDRQVAGVVILARTSKAAARLSDQFRTRRIKKLYWAAVNGRLDPPSGVSEIYLVREGSQSRPASPHHPQAQRAALSYRTIRSADASSLLEIDLLTGRRHQIRTQLAALGHPILGDLLYGSKIPPRNDSIGLLSRSLTIEHPIRGESMTFQSDPPDDWPWWPHSS